MHPLLKKQKTCYIILALIIIAGICRFSYGFFVQKAGMHSDEVWSFGLANSYYEPYIQYTDDTSAYKNINTWITNDTFEKYLTVQKGERFSFGSVYHNLSCDTHPPLYFFMLHFLCSFFPNQFIFSLGFILNMIAYIFIAIFMYKLLMLITKSKKVSLIGVLFSTFSLGMLDMAMFVRMYLSVAAIALIYTYLNARLFFERDYRKKFSSYILIGITALAGSLTDNFFLPYAFATTFIMCLCWCIKKEFKIFIKYAVSAAAGVGLSILIFPKTFLNMLASIGISIGSSNASTVESVVNSSSRYMSVPFQFRLALGYINKALFGHSIFNGYKSYAGIYISCALFIMIIILAFLSFLFRKDAWFIKLCQKLKSGFIHFFQNFNFITLSLLCSVLTTCLSAAYIADLYGLKDTGNRYVFTCLPAAMILFILIIWKIFTGIFRNKTTSVSIALVLILGICSIFSNKAKCTYFMQSPSTIYFKDINKNANFIVISSAKWMLVEYAAALYGCNEVFFTTNRDLDEQLSNIDGHNLSGDTYILIDMTNITGDNEVITGTKIAIINSVPTYIENDFIKANAKQATSPNSQSNLQTILEKCQSLSFVNNLKYIGCDGLNFCKIDIYKVNLKMTCSL